LKEITYKESLQVDNRIYIDVRSPGEFSHDHVPGAVNLPVFDDFERSEIGKIYKLAGKDEAVIRGTEIAGKKLKNIISEIYKHKDKNQIIMCARGGMRSGGIAALLESLGMNIFRLIKGYKGYRNFINDKLENIKIKPEIFIIQGLTGTGKTKIIKGFKNSINLEEMAGHRSSLFGGIGLEQNSQKKFETLLYSKITELENEKFIVIEGESKKIGNLHIPANIFHQMRQSPMILITAGPDRRIKIILEDYTKKIDSAEVINIVKSLSTKIGKKNIDTLISNFQNGDLYNFTALLLEKYYDPLYSYTFKKINFIGEIRNIDTSGTIDQIIKIINNYLNIK